MDLKEVCRTCLSPSASLLSIFSLLEAPDSEVTKLPTILDILKIFTDISVSNIDGLPNNICNDCLYKVYQSYNFKLKFNKAESVLNKLKDHAKRLNNSMSSTNEYEEYTGTNMELDETEKIEDCAKSNNTQLERSSLLEIFEHDITNRVISLVQNVKQEPKIETNMEESETDSNVLCLKSYLRCSICTNIFKNKSHLKDHMITHAEERPFQCEICPKKFGFDSILTLHMRREHYGVTRKLKCEKCWKIFGTKCSLNRHLKLHDKV